MVKATVCKTVYRWFESIPWDGLIPMIPEPIYASRSEQQVVARDSTW